MASFTSTNVPQFRAAAIGPLGANANSFGTVQAAPQALSMQNLSNIQTDQPGKMSNEAIDYVYLVPYSSQFQRLCIEDVQVGSLLFIIKRVDRTENPLKFKTGSESNPSDTFDFHDDPQGITSLNPTINAIGFKKLHSLSNYTEDNRTITEMAASIRNGDSQTLKFEISGEVYKMLTGENPKFIRETFDEIPTDTPWGATWQSKVKKWKVGRHKALQNQDIYVPFSDENLFDENKVSDSMQKSALDEYKIRQLMNDTITIDHYVKLLTGRFVPIGLTKTSTIPSNMSTSDAETLLAQVAHTVTIFGNCPRCITWAEHTPNQHGLQCGDTLYIVVAADAKGYRKDEEEKDKYKIDNIRYELCTNRDLMNYYNSNNKQLEGSSHKLPKGYANVILGAWRFGLIVDSKGAPVSSQDLRRRQYFFMPEVSVNIKYMDFMLLINKFGGKQQKQDTQTTQTPKAPPQSSQNYEERALQNQILWKQSNTTQVEEAMLEGGENYNTYASREEALKADAQKSSSEQLQQLVTSLQNKVKAEERLIKSDDFNKLPKDQQERLQNELSLTKKNLNVVEEEVRNKLISLQKQVKEGEKLTTDPDFNQLSKDQQKQLQNQLAKAKNEVDLLKPLVQKAKKQTPKRPTVQSDNTPPGNTRPGKTPETPSVLLQNEGERL